METKNKPNDFMEELIQRLSHSPVVKMEELYKGKAIFTQEDVEKSPWPLVRILRQAFVNNNITQDVFAQRHKDLRISEGVLPCQIPGKLNNLLKALRNDTITWGMFETIMFVIMGHRLKSLAITMVDPHGTEQEYTFYDLGEMYIPSVEARRKMKTIVAGHKEAMEVPQSESPRDKKKEK